MWYFITVGIPSRVLSSFFFAYTLLQTGQLYFLTGLRDLFFLNVVLIALNLVLCIWTFFEARNLTSSGYRLIHLVMLLDVIMTAIQVVSYFLFTAQIIPFIVRINFAIGMLASAVLAMMFNAIYFHKRRFLFL